MTWTDPTTWGASDTPTAAQFNAEIRDDMQFLYESIHNPFGIVHTAVDPRRWTSDVPNTAANAIRYLRTIGVATFSTMRYHVAVSSGNIGIAVYTNSGVGREARPDTRLATTGAFACPASGAAQTNLGGTVVVTTPGEHWFALSADNTTATFRGPPANIAGGEWTAIGTAWTEQSGHPPPATPLSNAVNVSPPSMWTLVGS